MSSCNFQIKNMARYCTMRKWGKKSIVTCPNSTKILCLSSSLIVYLKIMHFCWMWQCRLPFSPQQEMKACFARCKELQFVNIFPLCRPLQGSSQSKKYERWFFFSFLIQRITSSQILLWMSVELFMQSTADSCELFYLIISHAVQFRLSSLSVTSKSASAEQLRDREEKKCFHSHSETMMLHFSSSTNCLSMHLKQTKRAQKIIWHLQIRTVNIFKHPHVYMHVALSPYMQVCVPVVTYMHKHF